MPSVLRIDASARQSRSLTRKLANLFIEEWMEIEPNTELIVRDVGKNPPTIISEAWIAAVFTEEDARTTEQHALLEESDQLIRELERADLILISSPMYNYGMPAALKAWVDQVVRIGKTFTFDLSRSPLPLEPVLSDKSLVLLTSWGEFDFGEGGVNEGRNHLTNHIETVSKYFGVNSINHVGIEYQEFGDVNFESSRKKAFEDTFALARSLADSLEAS